MRILTISDVHFKEKYASNDLINKYLLSFKDKIIEINDNNPIDIVLITGDLAFSGNGGQYKKLSESIRKIVPDNIPVYSVLGNHDVNWTYLKAAIGNNTALEDLYNIKEEDLVSDLNKKDDSKYKMVFDEFRVNFAEEINKGITSNFEHEFCFNNYSGYVWNPNEKILFILLNSSWYSFGPGVINAYYEEKVKFLSENELKSQLIGFLGDSLSQEGKQSYFFTSYPFFSKVADILSNENDVRVITVAHHPPSWLKWEEQYTTSDDKRNLKDLIDITDLFITGHLHNPVQAPSVLQSKSYHLTNGSFLDYHFIDNQKPVVNPISIFPNNWFNIVNINSDGFSYESYKFGTKKDTDRGISYDYYWDQSNSTSPNEFDFTNHLNPKDKKKVKESGMPNKGINTLKPRNLKHIINILQERRANTFTLNTSSENKIIPDAVNILKSQNEYYLLIINNLESMHSTLESAEVYEDLIKDNLFNSLITKLNEYSITGKLPVIAFYDFFKPVSTADTLLFSKYQNEKFLLFQSFKHKFFYKFKELYNFTELCIIHDTIIE